MKIWIKGGLWGAGIIVIIDILMFILLNIGGDLSNIAEFTLIVQSLLTGLMVQYFSPSRIALVLITFLAIYGFLLGALIGFVVGKFKKNSEEEVEN